jgi:type IV secretory pathway VirB10-like protein
MRSDFPASGKGEAVLESALASQLTQFGADTAGYSGLEDEVDNHWKELLGAAALSTLLAVGTEVNSGTNDGSTNSAITQALRPRTMLECRKA